MTTTASRRVQLSHQVHPLRDVIANLDKGRWRIGADSSPSWARDTSPEWQRQLLDSLTRGLPIGQFIIAELGDERVVIDGARRLTVITQALTEPGWALDHHGNVTYDTPSASALFALPDLIQTFRYLARVKQLSGQGPEAQLTVQHAERAAQVLINDAALPITLVRDADLSVVEQIRDRIR